MSILVTILALALAFLFTMCMSAEGMAALPNYIDTPSLIILLLLVIPVLISAGMFHDFRASFRRAFSVRVTCTRVELQRSMEAVKLARKSNFTAGIFGFLTAFVLVCKSYDVLEENVFWFCMAVAVLPVIYAAVFDLIFLAVYGRLKKRYIDFMQTGYDMIEPETAVTVMAEPETAVSVLDECDMAEAKQVTEAEKEQA